MKNSEKMNYVGIALAGAVLYWFILVIYRGL
jgi:hypothetical protein